MTLEKKESQVFPGARKDTLWFAATATHNVICEHLNCPTLIASRGKERKDLCPYMYVIYLLHNYTNIPDTCSLKSAPSIHPLPIQSTPHHKSSQFLTFLQNPQSPGWAWHRSENRVVAASSLAPTPKHGFWITMISGYD